VTALSGGRNREVLVARTRLVGADAAHPEGWLAHRGLYRTPEGGAHLRGDIQIPGPDAPEAAALTPTLRPGWLVCPKARKQSQTPADRRICRPPPLRGCRGDLTSGRPHGRRPRTRNGWRRDSGRSVTVVRPCRADRGPFRDARSQPLLLAVAGLQPPCSLRSRARRFGCPSAARTAGRGRRTFRDPVAGALDLLGGVRYLSVRTRSGRTSQ